MKAQNGGRIPNCRFQMELWAILVELSGSIRAESENKVMSMAIGWRRTEESALQSAENILFKAVVVIPLCSLTVMPLWSALRSGINIITLKKFSIDGKLFATL